MDPQYYEAIANRRNIWKADQRSDLYYQELIRYDAILQNLPKTIRNVLDLGCGDGYLSWLIAQKGYRVTGLDLSSNRLKKFGKVAQKREISQVIGDVTHTCFADESFDQIVCSEVMEHIENYQNVVSEAYRLLRSDGRFIVTVPYKEKLKTILCPHCQTSFHEHGHLHSFDKDKLSSVLKDAGFTILTARTLRHKLLVHLQYHTKMKYGFVLRNMDRLFSTVSPDFTIYLIMVAQK